ncbi:MAG: eukaryotic-like serine/threonine-protein kinase [Streptosporangiaceae bacterium]|jgi:serine/threonine protein kinase|nr:eukaryotic-like serine/threonine-protein kinase [Streptosporangiaceae bacterium]
MRAANACSLDFGLAAALEGADYSKITRSGEIPGSASYLAPELTDGQRADKASDLYAVGCLLSEMVLGKRVFASGDVHAVHKPPQSAIDGSVRRFGGCRQVSPSARVPFVVSCSEGAPGWCRSASLRWAPGARRIRDARA